jgi:serine/threonine-protein kinase
VPELEQTELKAHLETCESCQRELDGVAADRASWTGIPGLLATPLPEQAAALRQAMQELKADTCAGEPAADQSTLIDILEPSQNPQSLGRLGQYEVSEIISQGGMGIVLKAFDESLGRPVAIKVMAPQLAASPTARKRFAREGRAAASVGHDNVIAIYAVEETRGLPYLVMEYVAGGSLEERLRRDGPLPPEKIAGIGVQAAAGLEAAHVRGLVHRDVKPGNILVDDATGRAKVADFGLARAATDPRVTQSGLVVGTPQYMAPEQARGEPVDHRADLFSLGSVLYALCTGRAPFHGDNVMAVLRRVSDDTPRPVREINPAIPEWLGDIIGRLHQKDPADRFQSAGEVAELLQQGLAHLRQPAQVPAPLCPVLPVSSKGGKPMALIPCEECGKQISDRAYSCPHCGLRRLVGYEYRSRMAIFGWPLLHVAFGRDLATDRRRVAKGIIAVGDVAVGLLAIGSLAFGGLALGGGAIGVIALGGGAIGLLLALGGGAIGGIAVGGAAIGLVALGGGALGYYALGGGALGVHAYGGNAQDPMALRFFQELFGGWSRAGQ